MLRTYSTSFMCICVHYKLCELRMRRLFIAALYVSVLVAVAVFWLCSDLPPPPKKGAGPWHPKKRHRMWRPKKGTGCGAPAKKRGAERGAQKKAPKNGAPGKKRRRKNGAPAKKRGAEKMAPPPKKEAPNVAPLPVVFFTLRFQLLTFQKAERKSFFLCALL